MLSIKNYYVASVLAPRLEGEPYRGWNTCINWCQDHFGSMDRSWHYQGEGVFAFEKHQDYVFFMLKFG